MQGVQVGVCLSVARAHVSVWPGHMSQCGTCLSVAQGAAKAAQSASWRVSQCTCALFVSCLHVRRSTSDARTQLHGPEILVCLSEILVCLSVYLYVCLSVCLSACA